jgi:hypothetical protein
MAFMMATVLHCLLVLLLAPRNAVPASPATIDHAHSVCYTLAVAGLLTSIYWTFTKLPAASDSARFLIEVVIALALAEVCSVSGLVLFLIVHRPGEFWPLGIGALVVEGMFILPRAVMRD